MKLTATEVLDAIIAENRTHHHAVLDIVLREKEVSPQLLQLAWRASQQLVPPPPLATVDDTVSYLSSGEPGQEFMLHLYRQMLAARMLT